MAEPIPDLGLATTAGEFSLSQLAAPLLVLYFYPKDNTPGCTTEAGDFRDHHAEFEAAGATIVGVSRDSLASHERFRERQALPFALASDPDEVLCNAFDVIRDKNMYGRKVRGIERSTFVLDAQRNVLKAWRKVRVPGHAAEVLAFVREAASPVQ